MNMLTQYAPLNILHSVVERFSNNLNKEYIVGKNQHVVPVDGKWGVRAERSERLTSVHSTQGKAIDAARNIAQNQHSEIFIHGRNGQIRDRDSYGNDPCPPRDRVQ
jgi:hypothetical protein